MNASHDLTDTRIVISATTSAKRLPVQKLCTAIREKTRWVAGNPVTCGATVSTDSIRWSNCPRSYTENRGYTYSAMLPSAAKNFDRSDSGRSDGVSGSATAQSEITRTAFRVACRIRSKNASDPRRNISASFCEAAINAARRPRTCSSRSTMRAWPAENA